MALLRPCEGLVKSLDYERFITLTSLKVEGIWTSVWRILVLSWCSGCYGCYQLKVLEQTVRFMY